MFIYRLLLAIGMAPFLLMSCDHADEEAVPTTPTLLNIIVFDQSRSAHYIECDTSELYRLILSDAYEANVWVAGIRVLDHNSIQQEVLMEGPFHLSLMSEEKHSIYQVNKVRAFNENAQSSFDIQTKAFLKVFRDIILNKHTLPYSDIKGALQLAEIVTRQEGFQSAQIRLILLSDLLHDLPEDPVLGRFLFPGNTKIYTIGAAPSIRLEIIFPENKIEPLIHFSADFF